MAGLEEWSSPGLISVRQGSGTEFGLSALCGTLAVMAGVSWVQGSSRNRDIDENPFT